MFAKVKMNGSIGATIGYCSKDEKKAEIILANGASDKLNTHLLIKQFEAQAEQRPDLKHKIMQLIISHSPEDQLKLAGEKEMEILEDYIQRLAQGKGKNEGLNLKETQFIAIKHSDKKHIHYHVLINMVDNNGERVKDNNIGYKAKSASIDITKKHNLTRPISKELKAELAEKLEAKEQKQVPRQTFRMR